jgi:ribonuclease HII
MLETWQGAERYVCGVDEVGRGPLAGPVVTAAVVLDRHKPIAGLRDSKRLTARQRESLAEQIRMQALCWSLGRAEVAEIDALNILQASLLAMQRAIATLDLQPELALIDGNHIPSQLHCTALAVVGGDNKHAEIAAAAILAKVARDQEMVALDALYPEYGFAGHKGYPTKAHLAALQCHGPSPEHRRSFAPVRRLLNSG